MDNLIFLTGVGRSGTTLIQQMMNAHSQISFQPETHFFKRYILAFLLGKKHDSDHYKRAVEIDSYLKRLNEENQLKIKSADYTFNSLKEVFANVLTEDSSGFGADKDTEYVRYFPHLKKVYPHAYVINVIRDPRDVVLSRMKTPWGKNRSGTFHAAEYVYYLKLNRNQGPKLFGDRYIEIQYEKLLDDPEKEMTRLFQRLNLAFESTVLDYNKKESKLIAEDEKAWKGNADKEIIRSNSKKWENELDRAVVGLLEKALPADMEEMGYERSGARPSILKTLEFHAVYTAFQLKTRREKIRV